MGTFRAPGASTWEAPVQAGTGALTAGDAGAAPGGFVRRRLSDRIEQAFDQACEQGQIEVAACMLKGLDLALLGTPTQWDRRKAALSLLRTCATRLEALRTTQATETAAGDALVVSAA